MKKQDFYFILFVILLFLPFFVIEKVQATYLDLNRDHGLFLSFFKFAVLATMGEVIGLRIKSGAYHKPGFGLVPRAIVWGFIGVSVAFAFKIFGTGAPLLLEYMGFENATVFINSPGFSFEKLLVAFTISTTLNLFYAPVMMTFHKITDTHIVDNEGTIVCLFRPIRFGEIMAKMDWKVQWNFVFKKTIPLFWIPAQTINFLLPGEFRILLAALLGIVLGVLLAFASLKTTKK
jgi:hypothetical protein